MNVVNILKKSESLMGLWCELVFFRLFILSRMTYYNLVVFIFILKILKPPKYNHKYIFQVTCVGVSLAC
jgi:hypothetical protein